MLVIGSLFGEEISETLETCSILTTAISSDIVSNDGGDLVQRIAKLEIELREMERQITLRDQKISYLEEDSYCRVCMDKRINTVSFFSNNTPTRVTYIFFP